MPRKTDFLTAKAHRCSISTDPAMWGRYLVTCDQGCDLGTSAKADDITHAITRSQFHESIRNGEQS